ncbi:uncharacterized protein LOC124893831 [Capsicum annuum]|uniref:uncharacterized protein LOC124893831 n=1 Tax=Capsicum annuum TaxID=4072 RepID=UPI0007BEEFB3|nr:uncharacterized protein LOC124893831 [Capsicum annuum]
MLCTNCGRLGHTSQCLFLSRLKMGMSESPPLTEGHRHGEPEVLPKCSGDAGRDDNGEEMDGWQIVNFSRRPARRSPEKSRPTVAVSYKVSTQKISTGPVDAALVGPGP